MNLNTQEYTGTDIIDSLRFYYMLSTYLISRENTEYESSQSLNSFIRECLSKIDNKTFSHYTEVAYTTLPAEFLSFMEISSKGDRDQVIFKEVKVI